MASLLNYVCTPEHSPTEASIPIPGGRNLSPVKNRGKVRQCWDLGDRGKGPGGPGGEGKENPQGSGGGDGEGLSPAVWVGGG